jgi:hypothetical protein
MAIHERNGMGKFEEIAGGSDFRMFRSPCGCSAIIPVTEQGLKAFSPGIQPSPKHAEWFGLDAEEVKEFNDWLNGPVAPDGASAREQGRAIRGWAKRNPARIGLAQKIGRTVGRWRRRRRTEKP